MAKFKVQKVQNKGSKQEILPSRHARTQLTNGDPMQRTMNNYAKATPGPAQQSPSINDMGDGGMGMYSRGGMVC